ncbi:MAG: T9SS type A sorting domain-containing protein, partial [Aliifodinibius sp.]|nr:T9SS type A sorting domain-containing protein [Fodinibius sp.]NIV14638.1 T9SS type A sorting domain-containing protein [Fodinibius sp.]NIY28518.1 T9SS type A sorting domain-containing protein [Fodinibius sp.]
ILFTTSGGTMGLYSDTELPPQNFVLYQNQPNPFNPSTTIRYQLPHAATVRLDVYNILGQKVKTIVNARQKAGFYTVQWNSTDDSGNQVSSGLYIYRLNVAAKTKDEKFVSVKKMLLVR